MSDMTACLNDLSYIPSNNKQNEPTQRDIGETSNEQTQAIHNEFEELYASANKELYLSCDYVTRLDFMVKFTYFKVKGKLTGSIFNKMLEFFQNVFPTTKGYKLSLSYYAIKKTFKMIGLGYESIHACVNDCFLFRGEDHKDKQLCPVCNTSRWKDNNTSGKKFPKKVLRYFPIIPRLQRLYKSSHTTKEMTWHATGKCMEPGKMQHPVDGRAWKNFDTKYPDFAKEPRNVRLGLAANGFNPFGNLSQSYSMWPVILTTYNLPPWLCVENIDVATCQKFNMRAMVLWTINDFPARSSLSGWSGQGYKACPTCNEDTLSTRVLDKTTYVGYKRFLKKPHKWRRSLDFNGEIKDEDPPRKFDRDSIMAQLARFPTRAKGKHPMKGIDQHLGKIYTDSKSTLKRDYWVKNPDDETYDCAQNARNRAKSTVACRQGSQTLATLRDRQMQSSATQEYPSLIQTFFDTHTVGDVFLRDEDRCLYEEMLRLHGLGTYTDDQIMAKVRWGKQRRHIPDVSRVLAGRGKDVLDVPVPRCNHTFDVNELKKCNKQLQKQINMITKAMSSDDMYSQLFTQLQSQHESGSGSESGAAGDDESGNDEDADEDEEDADS
ncbi:hypothetical protein Tco_1339871 [Tanacetum coccineum]